MFDTPYGSPLSPPRKPLGFGGPDPLAPLPAAPPPAPVLQQAPAPAAPGALTSKLPSAPPAQPKINMFDRQHIAMMLAQIGKGFAGARSFGDGLASSAGGISDMVMAEAHKKDTSEIGGPDSAFEIITHPDGTREFKPIAAVQKYLSAKQDREAGIKSAPKPGESQTWLGDAAYAVNQLPAAQRPGAWQLALQQGKAAGYDISEAPPEYSPTYSSYAINRNIGARTGSTNAATAAYRADQGRRADEGLALRTRNTNSVIAKRNAPPSTRKGGGLPPGFIVDNH